MTVASAYRWMFVRLEPLPLRFWRLALGTVSLLWLLSNLTNWSRDYTPDGMMKLYVSQNPIPAWDTLALIPGGSWTLLAAGFLVHLFFLAGLYPRVMSLLIWCVHGFLISLNPFSMNSEQYMFLWMFLYGAFIPWAAEKTGQPAHSMAARLFQIHVCLIYLISTFWKIKLDPAWFNGQSVYYVLMHPLWSRVAGQEWVAWAGVAQLFTYSSLVLEGSFAFLVWWRQARPLLVFGLMVFHLSLSMVMQHIGFFSLAMIASLFAWTRTEDFETLVAKIRPRPKSRPKKRRGKKP